MKIRSAKLNDMESIIEILSEANLPFSDINLEKQDFLIATKENKIIGIIGIEVYDGIGLLRSLAIISTYRNKGIGSELYREMIFLALSKGIKELYLLTTTAERFFSKLGFNAVSRDDVPISIRKSEEFANICPASALCMTKKI